MNQPHPRVSPDDVKRIIERDFSIEFHQQIAEILNAYQLNAETCRVQLAALKQAAGNVGKLREMISLANQDFRDLIAAAEYPAYSEVRTSHLPDDELQQIIDADWKQFCDWLSAR